MDFLVNIILGMSYKDSIDIIVIAFIIYRFLSILRGTRAVQMLLGLMALGSLYWFSISYQLHSLNYILALFFEYIFIILIILFQEEIRAALVIFGETNIFSSTKNLEIKNEIQEIVDACYFLSEKKIGALVAIERNHGLLNYLNTGTKVDCKIHSDILFSFFQPSSPLHDGAVIIRDGKVGAAGCFLPLSKSPEIDRHYGTRHRAAIGLTEVSDSIVVVVSEETGKVSFCHEGKIYPTYSEAELRGRLTQIIEKNILKSRNSIKEVRS